MEQIKSGRQNAFERFLNFLFKDYPAWLWHNPNIFKMLLFPFLLVFKIFDVLVTARGAQKYRQMRIWFASILSFILVVLIFNAGLLNSKNFGNNQSNRQISNEEISDSDSRTSASNKIQSSSNPNQESMNYYIFLGLIGILALLIWISVFTKAKNTNYKKSEVIVGQNKKSNYNKN